MNWIGRSLQVSALVLLPLAMVLQLTGLLGRPVGVSEMLLMLVFGFGLFYLGRIVEGYSGGG